MEINMKLSKEQLRSKKYKKNGQFCFRRWLIDDLPEDKIDKIHVYSIRHSIEIALLILDMESAYHDMQLISFYEFVNEMPMTAKFDFIK